MTTVVGTTQYGPTASSVHSAVPFEKLPLDTKTASIETSKQSL